MISHSKEKGMCVVKCKGNVEGQEVYAYCMDMVVGDPEIAQIPNVWDFTDVQILGTLDKLTDLHQEIGPLIKAPVRVAFVSNLPLTRAIAKRYVELFVDHPYLEYEVFSDVKKSKQWASKH